MARGRVRHLSSAFDVTEVETEQGAWGAVVVNVVRAGIPLHLTIPGGRWELRSRPALNRAALTAWKRAAEELHANDTEAAMRSWTEVVEGLPASQWSKRAELWMTVGQACGDAQRWAQSSDAYARARRELSAHGTRRQMAMVWASEAAVLSARGRLEDAESRAREAVLLLETEPESLLLALVLHQLGSAETWTGKYENAGRTLRRCVELTERLAPESLATATALFQLAYWAPRAGIPELARSGFPASYRIREKLAPDSIELAESLRGLGLLAVMNHDRVAAEAYTKECVELLERIAPASYDLGVCLANLGNITHDTAEAERLERRALVIVENVAPGSPGHADNLDNLGLILTIRGDFDGAERALRKSLALFEHLAPKGIPVGYTSAHLGWLAASQRRWATAEQLYRRALENIPAELYSSALAWVLVNEGKTDEAKRLSRAAVDTLRSDRSSDSSLALALFEDGRVRRATGDYSGAEAAFCESLDLVQPLGADVVRTGQTQSEISDALLREGNVDAAASHAEQAVRQISSALPGTTLEAEALYRLGKSRRRQGRLAESAELLRRAIEAIEMQSGRLGGSDDARTDFVASFRDYYRDYIEVLVELDREKDAFDMSERYRARAFLAMLAERDLAFAEDLPEDLRKQAKEVELHYARVQAQLSSAMLASGAHDQSTESLRAQLREVSIEKDEVRRRTCEASPRVAALRFPEPLSTAEASSLLEPGVAALSFVVGRSETFLFVVRGPTAHPALAVLRLPIGESDLQERIRRLLDGIRAEDVSSETAAIAADLYRDLIAPADALLSNTDRLLLIPDGPLHRLPFACLIRQIKNGRPEYLVQRWALHNVLSATVYGELVKARRSASDRGSFVAFGDPLYPTMEKEKSEQLALSNLRSAIRFANGIPPLPFTRKEVTAIANLYPADSHVFIGAAATEEQVKRSAGSARHLHFACHSALDEESPMNSGLVLTVPPDPKDGEDDGLLQAWEIIEKLRLDADLVTLSACGTALGKETGGEGLIGLTRAFQYAGARSVLASLWAVNDESTADLMTRFYTHLADGASKADALRAAQLEMIRGGDVVTDDRQREIGGVSAPAGSMASAPFRWASFQLIGDWR
jgi:CHAT domain-containing protein